MRALPQHALAAQGRHVPGLGCWCAPPSCHVCHRSSLAYVAAHSERRVCPAAGPLLLIVFAVVTWYYSLMLVDAYRYPTIDGPTRNYTYIQAVRRYLGAHSWRAPALLSAACHCAAWLAERALRGCGALATGFPYMVFCGIVQYVNMFGTGIGCAPLCACTAQAHSFLVLLVRLHDQGTSFYAELIDCHNIRTLTTWCA